MERFIANLLRSYMDGKIDRRRFCETIALAATVFGAGEKAANAAQERGFSPLAINHISYSCPDYRRARDFYTSVLGMQTAPRSDNGREARLAFGAPGDKARSFLIPRNGRTANYAKGVVDRICYAVADWDGPAMQAALSARGFNAATDGDSLRIDDPFGYDVQLSDARKSTGFRR